MELKNGLRTDNGYNLKLDSLNQQDIITIGSNFMIGNGYLGYRGSLCEWNKDQYVGCIVTDTYDMADGKWRELCNVPNGLFTSVSVNGEFPGEQESGAGDISLELDLKNALFRRTSDWPQGRLTTERWASYRDLHLIALNYRFVAGESGQLKIITGIDGEVWNLNGEHLKQLDPKEDGKILAIRALTHERELEIDVLSALELRGKQPVSRKVIKGERQIMRELTFSVKAGEEVAFNKYVVIYTGNDTSHPYRTARKELKQHLGAGYVKLKETHIDQWQQLFDRVDVNIEGDLEAQTALRFNLYHNIIATPAHSDRLPIGARGLSCQAYQGAAFWDQEIFNMPMFLYTKPEFARNILKYRYHTLDGARKKAANLGYRGAFYAWISGKTGQELCPSYFFKDVISGRKIHNHFNDWQIHVSSDIAYAVWNYYLATGDRDFIVNYGAEILFEVARFLYSHAYFKKDKNRYEFIRLLGPDEYHENVDNNAYTNYLSRFVLEKALEVYRLLKADFPEQLKQLSSKIGLKSAELEEWLEMKELIYLPRPDEKTGLIEQFDGYFELENVTPEVLEQRLIDSDEYWGWPNGVAVETQVIKQADVIQLFCLLDQFSEEVEKANFEYYRKRTEHGSSLSPSAYAIIAARVDKPEQAYRLFMKSATIDLYNTNKAVSGGTFIGGIHTAACGASWQVIARGFAGIRVSAERLEFDPVLPEKWEKINFDFMFRYQLLEVTVEQEYLTIRAREGNQEHVSITARGQTHDLAPGDRVRIKV